MFPYEPAALPQACRAGQSAVAPTTRGRHSESSLEAHTHNPAHCAPSYLDFRREHKHGDALLPCRLGAGQSGLFFSVTARPSECTLRPPNLPNLRLSKEIYR
jgi:hypothetical protein